MRSRGLPAWLGELSVQGPSAKDRRDYVSVDTGGFSRTYVVQLVGANDELWHLSSDACQVLDQPARRQGARRIRRPVRSTAEILLRCHRHRAECSCPHKCSWPVPVAHSGLAV